MPWTPPTTAVSKLFISNKMKKLVLAVFLSALCALASAQDFRLAAVFSDHMVLQRETEAPVWGWAQPGSRVTVIPSWSGVKYPATAGSDGRWEVRIATPAAGGPFTLTVDAAKQGKVVLQDVLVGEVWLCSGQSNMAMSLIGNTSQGVEGAYEAILEAPEYADRIRFFDIRAKKAFSPQDDVDCVWERTDGEVAAKVSALAYFFAKRLTRNLGVPVGIIANPWGGSMLPPWMSADYLGEDIKGLIPEEAYGNIMARSDENEPEWNAPRQVGTMYNARMYPVRGYALRGFLWYQGCSELMSGDIAYYDRLQAAMVRCWRDMWGDTENKLPFYFTLIAPYGYHNPEGPGRGYFVENQLAALDRIPNSGVAVTETLGDLGCIHPGKKKDVADQFAVLALEKIYGVRTGIGAGFAHPDRVTFPAGSPVQPRTLRQAGYDLEIQKSDKADAVVRIRFVDAYKGLGHSSDYGFAVKGFEVAGPDRVFYPVPAKTEGNTVVLDCAAVPDAVAVRYAFHNWCEADLTTSLGLPVASFRTDDWPMDN